MRKLSTNYLELLWLKIFCECYETSALSYFAGKQFRESLTIRFLRYRGTRVTRHTECRHRSWYAAAETPCSHHLYFLLGSSSVKWATSYLFFVYVKYASIP